LAEELAVSKRLLVFLNVVIAFVGGFIGGVIALMITILLYLTIGVIIYALFHWEFPIPSETVMEIIYGIYLATIGILTYRWLTRRSQYCVTA
jgi:hypothetical protein